MISFDDISTGKLISLVDKADVRVIDVRPSDAYNGWQMQNESRGGHITHARSLPLKWTRYIDWIESVRHKQIFPGPRKLFFCAI